jgi:hypothetical protein
VELPPLVSQLVLVSLLINMYAFPWVGSTRGGSVIPPSPVVELVIVPEVVSVPTVLQIAFMPVVAQTE